MVGKICFLDLLLFSYDYILKKKDANEQVKFTSFYFLEKDRKFGAYPQRLGLNIFGEFRFGLLSFRFVDKGFYGSNIILNFVTFTHSNLAGRSSFFIHQLVHSDLV